MSAPGSQSPRCPGRGCRCYRSAPGMSSRAGQAAGGELQPGVRERAGGTGTDRCRGRGQDKPVPRSRVCPPRPRRDVSAAPCGAGGKSAAHSRAPRTAARAPAAAPLPLPLAPRPAQLPFEPRPGRDGRTGRDGGAWLGYSGGVRRAMPLAAGRLAPGAERRRHSAAAPAPAAPSGAPRAGTRRAARREARRARAGGACCWEGDRKGLRSFILLPVPV